VGALVWGTVGTHVAWLGGGLLGMAAYAVRTRRVAGWPLRTVHLASAAGGGAIGAALAVGATRADLDTWVVTLVLAAVLTTLPFLVPAQDGLQLRLVAVTAELPPSMRERLDVALGLRRDGSWSSGARRLERTWRALLRLLEAHHDVAGTVSTRGADEWGVRELLERRIDDHVTALLEGYHADICVRSAALALDDPALESARALTSEHQELSQAFVEVATGHRRRRQRRSSARPGCMARPPQDR
jgi:hypothetical protein